ncbi:MULTISPECIES: DUF2694 family protein [Mycolicibacter]|uniref:DUF2694 domain-containing protein n=1 Tax=Mycolicibacter virginiensis TaxID=1795032 RepID=A0A9X7NXQ8_9MYCO|nr:MULTISPECIES: DUF2694 family protein [Mycolicibacter]OBJ28530.1 hypothetical protein A5631_20845 [Mycolicibacter heraklionensis]PQM51221.1 DUF2694 domain-containing protein [Mycolicibacter virginiensis]ULP47658.1 DUF2694 domain-containing protein [Mycolicibacter virginiensis]
MTEPNPAFDAIHPSGDVLFRSCRGGYLHSVVLTEAVMDTDVNRLAEAIVLAADVSFLKAALEIRGEIVMTGHVPSAAVPTTDDLRVATERLLAHKLHPGTDSRG